ncbi:MAG TPA: hypothetical protein VNQ73_06580 [Ilumatobacter sp.]|nr:hypothetical protein [Ilumatobacter sp.]
MHAYTGYWLVYVNDASDHGDPVITCVPAEVTERSKLTKDARTVLVAADAFRDLDPGQQVVFFGEVTRWLVREKKLTWAELNVDWAAGLAYLGHNVPNYMCDCDPKTARIIANAADRLMWLDPATGRTHPVEVEGIKQMILDELAEALAAGATVSQVRRR